MAKGDSHKVRYIEATGLRDFGKRVVWNRLPSRFRHLLHDVAAVNSRTESLAAKVEELDRRQIVAIRTGAQIADQKALSSRLSVIEDLLAEFAQRLTEVEGVGPRIDARLAEIDRRMQEESTEDRLASIECKIQEALDSRTSSADVSVGAHSHEFPNNQSGGFAEGIMQTAGATRISYAQNFEDVILSRLFAGRNQGLYVDVGAAHPIADSVTQYFYQLGWRGINIEPLPAFFQQIQAERRRDINLNMGLGSKSTVRPFFEVADDLGMSTFDCTIAERLKREGHQLVKHYVPITTLESVCEGCVDQQIDFLKIDTEGNEAEVIRGADFVRFRPRVVIAEATEPGTQNPTWEDWDCLLVSSGYIFAYFDGLNRWYVRREDSHLLECFKVPPNFFDGFVPWRSLQGTCELERFQNQIRSLVDEPVEPSASGDLLTRIRRLLPAESSNGRH